MKLAEIRELMETFDGMNICRLELEDGAFSLVLSKEHTPAQPPASGRAFPPPGAGTASHASGGGGSCC